VTSPPEPLERALAARYRLEREIGRGGMATVYLATDLKHHRSVAIKAMDPKLAAGPGRDRFLREIEIVAGLSHPNILPLIDSGAADDHLYYVVPYVAGESLREKLAREHQLGVDEALRITGEIASGLAHAHAAGLVHRDIKPENVLLPDGHAQVTDFGIAHATRGDQAGLTTVGTVLGTPAYMSPEQAAGSAELDARSDQYSLACVLYEMLAGQPPFTGPTEIVLHQHLVATPRTITEMRPGMRPEIASALRVALSKSKADRFATIGAFVAALTTPGARGKQSPSVAVLPFQNLSSDPENEYFADGITEDVIAQLAKVRTLKVISRASVMPFKKRESSQREIASRLGVSNLLEGSVRRAGDRVRVVVQLVEAESDRSLWAETYDRELTDIFTIQSDIAFRIADSLRTELSREERSRIDREPTQNIRAYQHYLKGRQLLALWDPASMHRSIEQFRRALELDPRYAPAYAGIAHAYCELGELGAMTGIDAYPLAQAAAARALDLDPELSEAHTMTAFVKVLLEFDWVGAEREFRRALELRPGDADVYDLYGRLCSALGRFDEAVALQERAFELDPVTHKNDVATALLRAGRPAEAEAATRRALQLEADNARAFATLGWAQFQQGEVEEGLGSLGRAVELSPDETIWRAQLGQMLGLAGRSEDARTILRELETREANPYHLAYVEAGLGEQDRALDLLEQAVASRGGGAYGIKGSFLWAPIRQHPRFIALLRSMGLS
jgi:serine/threonine protein kinase/Tfp pilus assembly protein PilF